MKKTALVTVTILALGLGTTACSSGSSDTSASTPASSSPAASASAVTSGAPTALATAGGRITATDRNAGLEKGAGVAITITPGAKGQAKFQLIDAKTGKDYSDFYVFDYSTNTFMRHHNSAAMGKTYEYTMDLRTKKLLSVKDATGKDLSASTKKMNRWDSAQQENAGYLDAAQAYFQKAYGKTIQAATTQA